MRLFKIQDRVKYSVGFLRSCGIYSGPIPFARGTVIRVQSIGSNAGKEGTFGRQLLTIDWDGRPADVPSKVLNTNLAMIDDPETKYV